ncbi:DUF2339 domain-containing protein [Paenibacillus sp. N1-5-1-14]|uniref:DUF2339 domain-containing protein n=1 Tax=Paenibacillus radicibacter TaxID=2972488 RepID=UPI00215923D7|nr:DUF2339 domain-containing protein [Paenibacillus radicibacter]MCR8644697.1 DUF2339 domain-containing protein [Paenibacillus radicibacter]
MELNNRIDQLEKRIALLENQIKELKQEREPVSSPVVPSKKPTILQAEIKQAKPITQGPVRMTTTPQVKKANTDWEQHFAKVWLPRIFIVVLLLGVLWGFTAAVNAGIITEPVRVLLGLIATALLFWQGEKQIKAERFALGKVLLGGSVAILMLTLFAAHMLYDYTPSWAAFILYILTIALSIWLSLRHQSQALIIVSLLGGYLIPFLIKSDDPNIWMFAGFEAVFSSAMIILAYRFQYWGAYYTALSVHIPLVIGYIISNHMESRTAFIIAVMIHHLVLFALFTFQKKHQKVNQYVSLFIGFSLLVLWMGGLYGIRFSGVYQTMILTWGFIYVVAAYWLHSVQKNASAHITIASFAVFLWLVHVLDGSNLAIVLLIKGMLTIMLGMKLLTKLQQVTGSVVYLIGFLLCFEKPISEVFSSMTLSWLVLILSLLGMYVFVTRIKDSSLYTPIQPYLLWGVGAASIILISQITSVLSKPVSKDYQHLILSTVWIACTIIIVVIGVVYKKKVLRISGIVFLFITLAKMIFVDLPFVSTAIRAILFIALGSVGIALSRLYYRRKGEPPVVMKTTSIEEHPQD